MVPAELQTSALLVCSNNLWPKKEKTKYGFRRKAETMNISEVVGWLSVSSLWVATCESRSYSSGVLRPSLLQVWKPLDVIQKCSPHFMSGLFVVELWTSWSGRAFSTKTQQSCPCPMTSQHTKWHVKLLYIRVMKSMIELWEVNLNLFHHIYLHFPVYQKSVCCYCVHTLSVICNNYTEQKTQITTFILTIDHEAILHLITDYSYSNVCISVCV